MRMQRMIAPLLLVPAALPAQAQETRGNINGIVQDKGGVRAVNNNVMRFITFNGLFRF